MNIGPDEEILPSLGYLVAGLTSMLAKLAEEKFAPFEITPMQFAIMDWAEFSNNL
jgi:hypothetical protein